MTILTGIMCKNGIVIASDSQTTSDLDYKRTNEIKLHPVLLHNAEAIVGGTGEMRFTNRVVEVFKEKSDSITFAKPREVADVAEESVRYIVDRYFGDGPTRPDENSRGFAMMLGVHCGGAWEIFVVDNQAVAASELKYAATGSAEQVAEYLLGRMYAEHYEIEDALRVAVYVIEESKKFDLYCGGGIQAFALRPNGAQRIPDRTIKEITDYVSEKDTVYKALWQMIAKGPSFMEALQELLLQEQEKRKKPMPSK